MIVFNDVAEYNRYLNLSDPLHPLMDSRQCKESIPNDLRESAREMQINLYRITVKKVLSGTISYGKQRYEAAHGFMLFGAPGQVVSWDRLKFLDGYAFTFHPDLVKKHPALARICQYRYFSYDVHDALFMTPEEEQTIDWLFTSIHRELVSEKELASEDIVVSLLLTALAYAERFYDRQYRDTGAEPRATSASAKVRQYLQSHYGDLAHPVPEVPRVAAIASALHMSPNHLTDLIRAETGQSTIHFIHDYILGQAEVLFAQTNLGVSDVAYRLGFSSVPYFSRLFKKGKGVAPSDIREKYK